jgi:spermidine synthase
LIFKGTGNPPFILILCLIFLLGCVSQFQGGPEALHGSQIRFDECSGFDRILVVDEGDIRHLRFRSVNSVSQSMISLSDPKAVPMKYIRLAMLGILFTPQMDRVLMIGLGGGTFTSLLRRHYPALWIDAVEIDPVVVEAAKRFFGVREDSRFHIHIEDGADFIEQASYPYDLIFLDAYTQDGLPEHLATVEFFNTVKARLSDNGVVIINLYGGEHIKNAIGKVFRIVFPETACIRTSDGLNLLLFSKASASMPEHKELVTKARRLTADLGLSFDLGALAERLEIDCTLP